MSSLLEPKKRDRLIIRDGKIRHHVLPDASNGSAVPCDALLRTRPRCRRWIPSPLRVQCEEAELESRYPGSGRTVCRPHRRPQSSAILRLLAGERFGFDGQRRPARVPAPGSRLVGGPRLHPQANRRTQQWSPSGKYNAEYRAGGRRPSHRPRRTERRNQTAGPCRIGSCRSVVAAEAHRSPCPTGI